MTKLVRAPALVVELLREEDTILAREAADIIEDLEATLAQLQGYVVAVQEVHAVCDRAGIQLARGEPCNDPECNTQAGHRVRQMVATLTQLREALETTTKQLRVWNTFGVLITDVKVTEQDVSETWPIIKHAEAILRDTERPT